jgi:hypothetical protein
MAHLSMNHESLSTRERTKRHNPKICSLSHEIPTKMNDGSNIC